MTNSTWNPYLLAIPMWTAAVAAGGYFISRHAFVELIPLNIGVSLWLGWKASEWQDRKS